MSIQSTTDKVADNARNLANNVLQSAQDAVQSTRDVANESLDKAETGVRHLRREASPVIDDLATRAQDLAARSIDFCADTGARARREPVIKELVAIAERAHPHRGRYALDETASQFQPVVQSIRRADQHAYVRAFLRFHGAPDQDGLALGQGHFQIRAQREGRTARHVVAAQYSGAQAQCAHGMGGRIRGRSHSGPRPDACFRSQHEAVEHIERSEHANGHSVCRRDTVPGCVHVPGAGHREDPERLGSRGDQDNKGRNGHEEGAGHCTVQRGREAAGFSRCTGKAVRRFRRPRGSPPSGRRCGRTGAGAAFPPAS